MKTFLTPLTRAEEEECFRRMNDNDEKAKEDLILHNMRLVAHVTKKYAISEEESEELISIGTIGLIKAVSSFKHDFGSRFATYAIRCIENEILMYYRIRKKERYDVSLFEPIGSDKEGNQIQLLDVIEGSEFDVLKEIEKNEDINKLMKNIDTILDSRELFIIKSRYGVMGQRKLTQNQIAETLGISRSYVSRIEKKALEKLKKFIE